MTNTSSRELQGNGNGGENDYMSGPKILDSKAKQLLTICGLYLTFIHLFVGSDFGPKSLISRLVKENYELELHDQAGQ